MNLAPQQYIWSWGIKPTAAHKNKLMQKQQQYRVLTINNAERIDFTK
jgi:hypothetical protein